LLAAFGPARAANDGLAGLIAPGARPERVAYGTAFAEGPAWSPAGFLVFVDIRRQAILRLADEAAGAVDVVLKPSGGVSGLAFDAGGRLHAAQGGSRRIVRFDDLGRPEPKVIADAYDGRKLNSPNDLALDPHGGIYFTDPRHRRGNAVHEQPVMGVYHVDVASGEVRRVVDDLEYPNGIRVSADGRTLYVADTPRRELWRFDILGPGRLGERKLLFSGDPDIDGPGPDGIALDARGNVYATYQSLVVIAPDGRVIGRIPFDERPTNCTFGGSDWKTLYVTVRSGVFRVRTLVEGVRPFPQPEKTAAELAARPKLAGD
jgi:gluconolactonase